MKNKKSRSIFEKNSKLQESWTLYKKALTDSNYIVSNSQLTSKATAKWINREPELVLYPGIDKKVNLTENIEKRKQILFLGRLVENKNVHEIINQFIEGRDEKDERLSLIRLKAIRHGTISLVIAQVNIAIFMQKYRLINRYSQVFS